MSSTTDEQKQFLAILEIDPNHLKNLSPHMKSVVLCHLDVIRNGILGIPTSAPPPTPPFLPPVPPEMPKPPTPPAMHLEMPKPPTPPEASFQSPVSSPTYSAIQKYKDAGLYSVLVKSPVRESHPHCGAVCSRFNNAMQYYNSILMFATNSDAVAYIQGKLSERPKELTVKGDFLEMEIFSMAHAVPRQYRREVLDRMQVAISRVVGMINGLVYGGQNSKFEFVIDYRMPNYIVLFQREGAKDGVDIKHLRGMFLHHVRPRDKNMGDWDRFIDAMWRFAHELPRSRPAPKRPRV